MRMAWRAGAGLALLLALLNPSTIIEERERQKDVAVVVVDVFCSV